MVHLARAAILVVACIIALGCSPSPADDIPVDLELVLAVNVSGSIDMEEAALQREGYIHALANPVVLQAITRGILGRIAVLYMEWAGPEHRLIFTDWNVIDGEPAALAFNARLQATRPTRGMYTSISSSIEYALPLFDNNGFEGTRRVIDVSGDGPNNIGGLITISRDKAVAKGITINGLPIINDRQSGFGMPSMPNLELYFQECVIGGPRAFLILAYLFDAFGDAIRRKLLLEIAGVDPHTVPGTLAAPNTRHARVWPAQNRWVPPCDEGEQLLEQRRRGCRDY